MKYRDSERENPKKKSREHRQESAPGEEDYAEVPEKRGFEPRMKVARRNRGETPGHRIRRGGGTVEKEGLLTKRKETLNWRRDGGGKRADRYARCIRF